MRIIGSIVRGVVVGGICLLTASSAQAACVQMVCYIESFQENPAIVSNGVGTGRFAIDTVANTVSFEIHFGGLTSAESVAHIHGPADPGVSAAPIFTLPAGNPKVGVWNYSESDEADILAGRMYVNIHTTNNSTGEIRGQIVSMVSPMSNYEDVTPTTSTARGIGLYMLDTTANTLKYYIAFSGLSTAETVAHIHGFALQGAGAAPIHTLALGSPTTGTFTYTEDQETSIAAGLSYVNIHSTLFPSSEIRGQITSLITALDGAQAGVSTSAIGSGIFAINTAQNKLSYNIRFQGLSSSETAAHFHGFSGPGVDSAPIETLASGSPKFGVWNYLESQESGILGGQTYVNIHTTNFGNGEIRGQVWEPLDCPPSSVSRWEMY